MSTPTKVYENLIGNTDLKSSVYSAENKESSRLKIPKVPTVLSTHSS